MSAFSKNSFKEAREKQGIFDNENPGYGAAVHGDANDSTMRRLARRTGLGICTVQISEIYVTGVTVGGNAYAKVQMGSGKEQLTDVVQSRQDQEFGPVLNFRRNLQLEVWNFGGPLSIVIIDQRPPTPPHRLVAEEPAAWVEIPASQVLRLLNEPGEYFCFDLALGGTPPGHPQSLCEPVYGSGARIALRLQRMEGFIGGTTTQTSAAVSTPQITEPPAVSIHAAPAGFVDDEDDF